MTDAELLLFDRRATHSSTSMDLLGDALATLSPDVALKRLREGYFGCRHHFNAVHALVAEAQKLRALLWDLEWKGGNQEGPTCPSCNARSPVDGGKDHYPGCALAAALR